MAGASTSIETGKQHACSAAHCAPQHNRQHAAHRTFTHGFGNDAETYYPVLPKVLVFRGQGCVYVPRKGIDEACSLPTSACPNEMAMSSRIDPLFCAIGLLAVTTRPTRQRGWNNESR
jgi:hypothetical protein